MKAVDWPSGFKTMSATFTANHSVDKFASMRVDGPPARRGDLVLIEVDIVPVAECPTNNPVLGPARTAPCRAGRHGLVASYAE